MVLILSGFGGIWNSLLSTRVRHQFYQWLDFVRSLKWWGWNGNHWIGLLSTLWGYRVLNKLAYYHHFVAVEPLCRWFSWGRESGSVFGVKYRLISATSSPYTCTCRPALLTKRCDSLIVWHLCYNSFIHWSSPPTPYPLSLTPRPRAGRVWGYYPSPLTSSQAFTPVGSFLSNSIRYGSSPRCTHTNNGSWANRKHNHGQIKSTASHHIW